MTDERKDLPPVNSPNFLEKVREALSVYLGNRGNGLDRGVTLRDLTDAGLVELRAGFASGNTRTPIGGAGSLITSSSGAVYEPDLTPPPTPTGFVAASGITTLLLECDPQTYTQGHGHAKSKLYGATWTAGPLPVFADAVVITEFSGTVASHATNPATTWHLWLKWVTADGVESVTPAGGTNGVVTRTGEDVALLLEALTGEITESQLYADLGARIDLIDAPTTGLQAQLATANASIVSINATLADIASTPAYAAATTYAADDLVTYDGKLYQAKSTTTGNLPTNLTYWTKVGDYASIGDAVAGHAVILSDHETRITDATTGLAAEVTTRTTLQTQMRGAYTGTDVNSLTTGLIYSEKQARSTADSTEVTARQLLSSTMIGATDATGKTLANVTSGIIFDEKTARTTSDTAQVGRLNTLEATVNNATTGVVATSTSLDAVKLTVNNVTTGVAATATRVSSLETTVNTGPDRNTALRSSVNSEITARTDADTALATRATNLETSVNSGTTGLATKASVSQVATAKAEAIAASATVTDTISARLNTGDFAAVQVQSSANASSVTGLLAQYTVKLDVGGKVSGYGLASSSTSSEFAIRADRFYIAPPETGGGTATQIIPFVVQATATTINGVSVPAGVYINDAYIKNGTITTAKIGNAQIDDAKISALSASKITAGSIGVGSYISSTAYTAGSAGWRINADGTAEFSGVVVRGTVFATAGQIGGITISSNAVRAGQTAYNTGTGFFLGSNGTFSLGNSGGNRLTWDGTNLNVVGGGTFSGALSAATGTFSGSLTASAVNAVDTLNLRGQAVTIPVSAYTAGGIAISDGLVTLQTLTFTSTGAPVVIAGSMTRKNSTYTGLSTAILQLRRNGILLTETATEGNGNIYGFSLHGHYVDVPGEGSVTYTLVGKYDSAWYGSITGSPTYTERFLSCMEVKR